MLQDRPFHQGFRNRPFKKNSFEAPPGICRWIFDTIRSKYKITSILDPCAGAGNLTRPWRRAGGVKVIEYEITRGRDFFDCQERLDVDLVLCNPPFCRNPRAKESCPVAFLRHILDVVPRRTPIVLFVLAGLSLNSRKQSNRYAGQQNRYEWLREQCPPITSRAMLPQDTFFLMAMGLYCIVRFYSLI